MPNLQQAKGYTYFTPYTHSHKNIGLFSCETIVYRCADIQFNVSHSTFPTCWSLLVSLSFFAALFFKKTESKNHCHLSHINETITILLYVWFVGDIWMNGEGMTLLINKRERFFDSNSPVMIYRFQRWATPFLHILLILRRHSVLLHAHKSTHTHTLFKTTWKQD